MPTYEYVCEKCGHKFERFQAITARPIRKCPKCGKSSAKRLIGVGSGIIFKGSGFYETDYRSESYKKAEKSEKGAPDTAAAEKKTDTKAKDSKTADKGAAKPKDKKKTA
jgi:putative FmdB family regulatory protein